MNMLNILSTISTTQRNTIPCAVRFIHRAINDQVMAIDAEIEAGINEFHLSYKFITRVCYY